MANCCVILIAARGCLVTCHFCPGLAGFTLWCELPRCDKRFKVSVEEEISISGGEMSLWLFTAVEDLAKATNCGPSSSQAPVTEAKPFPKSSYAKNIVQKRLCTESPAEKWSSSQLHPQPSHSYPRDQNSHWLRTKSCLDTDRRNRKDEEHEIIKELVHLPLCSDTNISSWPAVLQCNRAKEGFIRTGSLVYQVIYELKPQAGQAQVGSGWIISKCPDWVELVILKSWTGQCHQGGCNCQAFFLQHVILQGNSRKRIETRFPAWTSDF